MGPPPAQHWLLVFGHWSSDDDPNFADFADLAAAYLVGFARAQGFNDGNKRTALASALVFLAVNGLSIHVPPIELYELTMSAAIGRIDDASVAAYLRDRLVPISLDGS